MKKKEETKIHKHYTEEEKLDVLLSLIKTCNSVGIYDFSTESKSSKFLNNFMNESCSLKYAKIHDKFNDAQNTYKLYTVENLWKFFTDPDVIEFILSSEKFNNIRVIFNKKYVSSLENKDWKKIEHVATVDERFERIAKLEKEYDKEFSNFSNFYKIKKYNSGVKPKVDYQSFLVYDGTDPTNINNIYEFPAEGGYKDAASYMRMCKYHWLRENKYEIEKLADAKVMMLKKYEETILNKNK